MSDNVRRWSLTGAICERGDGAYVTHNDYTTMAARLEKDRDAWRQCARAAAEQIDAAVKDAAGVARQAYAAPGRDGWRNRALAAEGKLAEAEREWKEADERRAIAERMETAMTSKLDAATERANRAERMLDAVLETWPDVRRWMRRGWEQAGSYSRCVAKASQRCDELERAMDAALSETPIAANPEPNQSPETPEHAAGREMGEALRAFERAMAEYGLGLAKGYRDA